MVTVDHSPKVYSYKTFLVKDESIFNFKWKDSFSSCIVQIIGASILHSKLGSYPSMFKYNKLTRNIVDQYIQPRHPFEF